MRALTRVSFAALACAAIAAPISGQTNEQADSCNAADASKYSYTEQIAGCTAYIKANPQIVVAYKNRGISFAKLHLLDRAIADFNEAIRLDPQDAGAYNNRGDVYGSLGQADRAVADLSEAIRLNPDMAEAYAGRSLAYRSLGQMDLAKADLDQAHALDPGHF
jgi:tetratricopeptide (TPR) repeat protein